MVTTEYLEQVRELMRDIQDEQDAAKREQLQALLAQATAVIRPTAVVGMHLEVINGEGIH